MEVRLCYFGGFRVTIGGKAIEIASVPSERLMAFVGLDPANLRSRKDVAEALWPSQPFSVTGNRLRTALVELRRALGDCTWLIAEKNQLGLDPGVVKTDLQEAKRLLQELKTLADPQEQFAALEVLIALIHPQVLPSCDLEWVRKLRQEWEEMHRECLVRAARLAMDLDLRGKAIQYSDTAINLDERGTEAWEVFLRASAESGAAEAAARRFAAVKRRIEREGWAFTPQLVSLAAAVRDGTVGFGMSALEPRPGALAVIGRAFQGMLGEEPELAAQFLMSRSFFQELNKNPKDLIPLLVEFRDSVVENSTAHIQATRALVHAHYMLNHHKEALQYAEGLLERLDNQSHIHTLALAISFSHFQTSNWEQAYATVKISEEAALRINRQGAYRSARSQRASFLWHQGFIDEAYEINLEAHKAMLEDPQAQPASQMHIIEYNTGMMLLHAGNRNAEARDWFEQALKGLIKAGNAATYGFIKPATGHLRVFFGDVAGGVDLLLEGIRESHLSTNVRGFEIAMDLVAATLAHLSMHSEALALLRMIGDHRDGRNCPRTPAEQGFVDRVAAQCEGATPYRPWKKLQNRAELVKATGQKLLEAVQNSTAR